MLVTALEARFGPAAEGLADRVHAIPDPERLKDLLSRVVRGATLAEMTAALQESNGQS